MKTNNKDNHKMMDDKKDHHKTMTGMDRQWHHMTKTMVAGHNEADGQEWKALVFEGPVQSGFFPIWVQTATATSSVTFQKYI